MTHQRAIEAGARALATKRKFEFPSLVRHFASGSKVGVALSDSAAVIDAYREFLAAEGFVVVPRERVAQHLAWLRVFIDESKPENWRDMQLRASRQLDDIEAMITAAQQEQNDAPPLAGGE